MKTPVPILVCNSRKGTTKAILRRYKDHWKNPNHPSLAGLLLFTSSATMQAPTHPQLHVRDAHDAHVVFEAVRQGLLQPIRRRLNEVERAVHVRSGSIFVWFESDQDDGLKRWTDGRVWGQSRMREPYLFYDEKLPYDSSQTSEVNRTPAFRFVDGVSLRTGPTSSAVSHQERSAYHHKGLVKQAYSAWVAPNPYIHPQKWQKLPTIEKVELLAGIVVPHGVYRSSGHTPSPPISPQAPRGIPSLPPLATIQGLPTSSQLRSHVPRQAEDQRVIQMLNSNLYI
ncbi:Gti1/Pac2 family-domain-containing protein [Coprinopsis sp. MPI-PUGE-AT-0042]|nr:Gti1/Pac2 family-domain-containing protein [Coprinopsis sp. MPI-PUGE-AT-0042]